MKNVYKNVITKEEIINLWRSGYTLISICRKYKKQMKEIKGVYITLYDSQRYIEPIIFDYQVKLMKVGVVDV